MRCFALLFAAFLTSQLAACADVPAPATSASPNAAPDRSASHRYNAEKNQGELSREIDKIKE